MKKILVIEDDTKMREGLVDLLKGEEYKIESAKNGRMGLDMIGQNDFDLVMTDLIMPVMGGMEVLREIKRIKPRTNVVIITAFGTIENAVDAVKAGASDYITKPFKIDEVQMKLRKILAETDFENYPALLNSDIIKAISNPIRKDTVKLLNKEGKLKFTEIKNTLKIDDPTKLSFHLRVLKSYNVIEQDSEKVYLLAPMGKKLMESLKRIEESA
ncbi:MAG: response regulator [Candidatus Methanoperedens sp.]|nr:response regulator [Candidatus Methanoperedens sp.]